jgi:hypothetical protein
VCGNGVVESGEDCDEGGTCIGGDNAGASCTSESQCSGQGVCIAGANTLQACDTDADCPWSQCVHCKVFGGVTVPNSGGKTCAANCTFESNVTQNLVAGIVTGGSGHYGVLPGTSTSFVHATGSTANAGLPPLALAGQQVFAVGKLRNNMIPMRMGQAGMPNPTPVGIVGATPGSSAIAVGALSCACVRAVEDMTCGGVLTEKDGTAATDCTTGTIAGTCSGDAGIVCYENDPGGINGNDCFEPVPPTPTPQPPPTVGAKTKTPTKRPTPTFGATWTPVPAGTCVVPDPCAGQKPCTYVHGAGNSATGIVGCNGLDANNLYTTQVDSDTSPPAPPTPPPGSGPPVVQLRNACECTTGSDCVGPQTCNADGRCACTTLGSPLTITFDHTLLSFNSCSKAAGVSAGKSLTAAVAALSETSNYSRLTLVLAGDLVTIPDGDIIDCNFTINSNATNPIPLLFYDAELIDNQSNEFFPTGTNGTIWVGATPTATPTNNPTPTNTPAGPLIAIGNATGDPGAQVSVAISLTKQGANIVAVTGNSDCHAGETCVCPAGNMYNPLFPQGSPVRCATPNTGECIYYTGCEESSDCPVPLVCRSGPPGSVVLVNSTAIGLVPSGDSLCSVSPKTVIQFPATGFYAAYGLDGKWCTDDDPQVSRGTVQTLPTLSGFSAGTLSNIFDPNNPANILALGPFVQTGQTVDCSALLAPTPSVSGMGVGGAFTALNQPILGDTCTTNVQWAQ